MPKIKNMTVFSTLFKMYNCAHSRYCTDNDVMLFHYLYVQTQECCYGTAGQLVSSYTVKHNPLYKPELYEEEDHKPHRWCCEESNECSLYKVYRETLSCEKYVPVNTGRPKQ